MKITVIILSIISIALLLSTLICGAWIQGQGNKIADINSSIKFHAILGIIAIIVTIVTLILGMIRK
jgi:hypothetical protein